MNKEIHELDMRIIYNILKTNKNFIIKAIITSALIGAIIAFSIPKTYTVNVAISLESTQNNNMSSLTGMASMMGISGLGASNVDAVNPEMFPYIINSTPFILEMYNMSVKPLGYTSYMRLNEYLNEQKFPWWNYIFRIPSYILGKNSSNSEPSDSLNMTIDPYRLTRKQQSDLNNIKRILSANIDKKNKVTIVTATCQDPEVAAIVADSAVSKLQKYIINYRTKKAQEDCKYLEDLCQERKIDYIKAQEKYARFMDSNRNMVLQKTQTEGNRLSNEMNIAMQIYTQVETQLQMAKAKVQEEKPVFAIVEPATVPLTPSAPNKKVYIILFMFLGFLGSSAWKLFLNRQKL